MSYGSLCRALLHCGLALALAQGCSILYEPKVQCSSDSDCVKLAKQVSELAGSYCEANVCVLPKEQAHACETHADCVNAAKGAPAICRNYECISLLAGECTQVLNASALASSPDVILMGAFAPLNNVLPSKDTVLMTYQLALDEISQNVKGAIGYSGYKERPFVTVTCRSDGANDLDGSFDHLTKKLNVPVVVTNQQSADLESEVTRLIADGTNTMFLSPLSSDPTLTSLKDRGRLWHMLGGPTDLAPAYLRLITEQVAATSGVEKRVLTVVNDVRAMGEIADLIEAKLTVNGLAVADAILAGTYQRVAVQSLVTHPTNPDVSQLLPAVMALKPNVIVLLAGPEVIQSGIFATESGWQSFGFTEAPRYVLSHHLFNDTTLRTRLSTIPGFENRSFGVNYAGAANRTLYQGYLSRLSASYPDAFVPEYENYYDAAHFAMLSVIGIAREMATDQITGDLAVQGFRRLIDKTGAPYDLLPTNLSTIATSILEASSTATIYLTGTLGPPDFNADGARVSGATVWCLKYVSGAATYSSGDVLYDLAQDKFNVPLSTCTKVQP